MKYVKDDACFSYFQDICLRAGYALSLFAFNNRFQQYLILESGIMTISIFEPFLESAVETERAMAAFQVYNIYNERLTLQINHVFLVKTWKLQNLGGPVKYLLNTLHNSHLYHIKNLLSKENFFTYIEFLHVPRSVCLYSLSDAYHNPVRLTGRYYFHLLHITRNWMKKLASIPDRFSVHL